MLETNEAELKKFSFNWILTFFIKYIDHIVQWRVILEITARDRDGTFDHCE